MSIETGLTLIVGLYLLWMGYALGRAEGYSAGRTAHKKYD